MSITQRRACQDKHWHASRGAAAAHLRALERLGKQDARTQPYACAFCAGWHVGRRPRNANERRRA